MKLIPNKSIWTPFYSKLFLSFQCPLVLLTSCNFDSAFSMLEHLKASFLNHMLSLFALGRICLASLTFTVLKVRS